MLTQQTTRPPMNSGAFATKEFDPSIMACAAAISHAARSAAPIDIHATRCTGRMGRTEAPPI